MHFVSIKNFKHLHEKVLERDMHAHKQDFYACCHWHSTQATTSATSTGSQQQSWKLQIDLECTTRFEANIEIPVVDHYAS